MEVRVLSYSFCQRQCDRALTAGPTPRICPMTHRVAESGYNLRYSTRTNRPEVRRMFRFVLSTNMGPIARNLANE